MPPLPDFTMGEARAAEDPAAREILRHALATIAYRGCKAIHGAPESFPDLAVAEGTRTPVEILAHISDLFELGLRLAKGERGWRPSPPSDWTGEVERFHTMLQRFDEYLAGDEPLIAPARRLLQGPIADALTHVGQLTLLRRVAGRPVRGESYVMAQIEVGRLGPDQAPPAREFD